MACGYGLLAQDCAADHWCRRLGARPGTDGWRAPCPACGAPRALEFSVHGRSIRWNSFCAIHDRDALRPVLRKVLGECLPGRAPKPASRVQPGEPTRLALSGLPLTALRVALLEMDGLTRSEALSKLGIDRTTRYRIRAQLSQWCDKPAVQG